MRVIVIGGTVIIGSAVAAARSARHEGCGRILEQNRN
jgi:hypothetical protein